MLTHDLDLVTVFGTHDSFALTLAKSSLEDAGIEYLIEGVDPTYLAAIPGAYGCAKIPFGTTCSCGIQVALEYEREARALLGPLQDRQ
jgi:hypothetical protein